MMWMPLRAPKMYGRIFGFQRLVWWPKCTPASRSWRMRDGGFRPGGLCDCLIHLISSRFSTAPFTGCLRPDPPATLGTLQGRV